MKRIILILAVILILPHSIYAKAVAPKPGTTNEFSSSNKAYSIEIEILGYPDNSPSRCTFKKEGKPLWTKEISTTPGFVDISDDGKYFVSANWGWYDEGGYKSLSFYDTGGNLLKTIEFGSVKENMRWLKKTCISKDGNYYMAASGHTDNSQVTLYFVPTQTEIWDKTIGLEQIDDVLISQTGSYILISTFDFQEQNILLSYLNKTGEVLWEKKIDNGHSWDKDLIWLSGDGMNFKIFDLNRSVWQHYENKNDKIKLKE